MEHPEVGTLRLVEESGVLHVTLDRPDQRNAISAEMAADLEAVVAHATARRGDLRALVIRGTGGVFCAGGDLKVFASVFQDGAADRDALVAANRSAGRFLAGIAALPQVVVCAIEGAAMGGGVGLAAVADVCVTTADARFSTTETTLGIVPAQIIPFLTRRLGATTTRRITVTAARFDGAAAHRIGLADEVVADGDALTAAVERVLDDVRRCAPGANAATKDLLREAVARPLDDYLDHAAGVFADTLVGDEAREGIGAFVQKRRPAWRDRTSRTPSSGC